MENPKVKITLSEQNKLTFVLNNTDISIANGLRRVILKNIQTPVFEEKNMTFFKNTSRLNNEILKQRLGCIPIIINDLDIPFSDYLVEIHKVNEGTSIEFITTEDFKIKNIKNGKYLTPNEVKKIFPPNQITKDYILFTRLRPRITENIPGEELNLNAKISLSSAAENGMYNVVSTIAYGFTLDPILQDQEWKKYAKQLNKLEIDAESFELEKTNWYNHKGKRFYQEKSFDFIMETIGNFTNEEIIIKACDNIIERIGNIVKNKEAFVLTNHKTSIPYCYDITLHNEDYTIGKIIEYVLHTKYYQNSKILSFVGFRKNHPHDINSIIRIAFVKETTADSVYPLITQVCAEAAEIYNEIKSQV